MGQVILVLGAFTLLIFMTMTVNQAISNRMDDNYQAVAVISATSLAQSMINQVCQKAFDDSALIYPADDETQLTPVGTLGPDVGEVYATYDDIDDFDDYVRKDTSANGMFTTSVSVVYLNPTNLNSTSAVRTFYKKVTATVTAQELKNIPISLSRIVSY